MKGHVLSPKQLAERWSVHLRSIYGMVERGELPHFRPGGKLIRFKISEIEGIEQGTISANDENCPAPSADLAMSGASHCEKPMSQRAKELAREIALMRRTG